MTFKYGEEIMMVGRTKQTQSTSVQECDRQTDRCQTDRITITKTAQRIASRGKNRLDKYWVNQEVLYDYKATLNTETWKL